MNFSTCLVPSGNKKTPGKSVKGDLPAFLFTSEMEESAVVNITESEYDRLKEVFSIKVKQMDTLLKTDQIHWMKTNLSNNNRILLQNPENGQDSFFIAIGHYFMQEYAILEPSDVVS